MSLPNSDFRKKYKKLVEKWGKAMFLRKTLSRRDILKKVIEECRLYFELHAYIATQKHESFKLLFLKTYVLAINFFNNSLFFLPCVCVTQNKVGTPL